MKYLLQLSENTQLQFEKLRAPFEKDEAFVDRVIAAYYANNQKKDSQTNISIEQDAQPPSSDVPSLKNQTTMATQKQVMPPNRAFTWVPTVYNFDTVLTKYIAFRKQTIDDIAINFKAGFVQFLEDDGYAKNAAISYCFPLSEREFDLFDRSLDELEIIAKGGREGLEAAFPHHAFRVDARIYVSLVNVFLVGKLWGHAENQRIATIASTPLIQAGFAGAVGSAAAIVSVGKNVGTFFSLLDELTYQPTDYYYEFFGHSYDDLEERLNAVI